MCPQVDLEHRVDLSRCQLKQMPRGRQARVGHKDVNVGRLRGQPADVLWYCQVGLHERRIDARGERRERLGAPRAQHQSRAPRVQSMRERQTDSTCRPGQQDAAAGNFHASGLTAGTILRASATTRRDSALWPHRCRENRCGD